MTCRIKFRLNSTRLMEMLFTVICMNCTFTIEVYQYGRTFGIATTITAAILVTISVAITITAYDCCDVDKSAGKLAGFVLGYFGNVSLEFEKFKLLFLLFHRQNN